MNIDLINDPRLIPQSDGPFLVFWDQPGQFYSDGIDWKTHIKGIAPKSHAMLSINQGKFVTQRTAIFNAYAEVPMEQYMIKGGQLTFVTLINNNPDFAASFSKSVQKRLTARWWVTQYDFLGIVGQALDMPWIHTPGLRYCSVDVLRHLTNACPKLPKEDQAVINAMPAQISPELLYSNTLKYEPPFSQYGEWDSKTGVLA